MDVAVLGMGLIGGSLLRALAATGHRVTGYDADPATRDAAQAMAAAQATAPAQAVGTRPGSASGADEGAWRIAGTVREAVAAAELVVLAVPLPAVAGVLDELVDAGYTGLVTDVTSVKTPVRELVDQRRRASATASAVNRPSAGELADPTAEPPAGSLAAPTAAPTAGPLAGFVGGHPMAGRETSGFAAAEPTLFHGCAWVLCLEPESTPLSGWLTLAALITRLGARVVPATAAEHDRAVAGVSHVPHLLATALAATAAADPLAATLAAGSFRDGTRVAASPPALIAAMCGGNAPAVGPALDAVLDALREAREALRSADPAAALRPWLAPGTAARAAWPPRPGPERQLPARVDALLELGRAGGWVTAVAADHRTVTAVRPAPPDPAGSPAGR